MELIQGEGRESEREKILLLVPLLEFLSFSRRKNRSSLSLVLSKRFNEIGLVLHNKKVFLLWKLYKNAYTLQPYNDHHLTFSLSDVVLTERSRRSSLKPIKQDIWWRRSTFHRHPSSAFSKNFASLIMLLPAVIQPPTFESLPVPTRIIEGSDAYFECKIKADPIPTVTWSRKGYLLRNDQRYGILTHYLKLIWNQTFLHTILSLSLSLCHSLPKITCPGGQSFGIHQPESLH